MCHKSLRLEILRKQHKAAMTLADKSKLNPLKQQQFLKSQLCSAIFKSSQVKAEHDN